VPAGCAAPGALLVVPVGPPVDDVPDDTPSVVPTAPEMPAPASEPTLPSVRSDRTCTVLPQAVSARPRRTVTGTASLRRCMGSR
jgi:hypothetical protein